MPVDRSEHLAVDMHSILASQFSHPFLFELLLQVGHYKFAHVGISLRTLYHLAVCALHIIYIIVSRGCFCLVDAIFCAVDRGIVALGKDANNCLDALGRIVEMSLKRLRPFIGRHAAQQISYCLGILLVACIESRSLESRFCPRIFLAILLEECLLSLGVVSGAFPHHTV